MGPIASVLSSILQHLQHPSTSPKYTGMPPNVTEVTEAAAVARGNVEEKASASSLWFDYNNDGPRSAGRLTAVQRHQEGHERCGAITITTVSSMFSSPVTKDDMRESNFMWHNKGYLQHNSGSENWLELKLIGTNLTATASVPFVPVNKISIIQEGRRIVSK
jgi:hypothetical protein